MIWYNKFQNEKDLTRDEYVKYKKIVDSNKKKGYLAVLLTVLSPLGLLYFPITSKIKVLISLYITTLACTIIFGFMFGFTGAVIFYLINIFALYAMFGITIWAYVECYNLLKADEYSLRQRTYNLIKGSR